MALDFSGQRSLGIIMEDYFSYNVTFTFNACREKRGLMNVLDQQLSFMLLVIAVQFFRTF